MHETHITICTQYKEERVREKEVRALEYIFQFSTNLWMLQSSCQQLVSNKLRQWILLGFYFSIRVKPWLDEIIDKSWINGLAIIIRTNIYKYFTIYEDLLLRWNWGYLKNWSKAWILIFLCLVHVLIRKYEAYRFFCIF